MIKKEGPGWRIIRDSSRDSFSTVIGGENWAIELTETEWQALAAVFFDLCNQYCSIQSQLMSDEDIILELDRNPWSAFLKGDKFGWSIKLILSQSDSSKRGAEIYWPRSVTESVSSAMRTMWDSCYL